MYWEKELETLPRADLEKLQLERLMNSLRQAARSPYYGKCPQIAKALSEGISSLEQFRELPFTTKATLREDYPWGMLAADKIPFIGYHMPFPALGYVETAGSGFRYVPASYQMMLNG